jgi:AraC-like DNA-binding protein
LLPKAYRFGKRFPRRLFYPVEVQIPDLGDVLWNPPAAVLGARNAIISGSGPKSHTRFAGALSIKHMLSGWAVWEVGGRRFRVEGESFLVLNHGTVYSLERLDGEPSESFCPFFAAGYVEAAARAARASQQELLDDPDGATSHVELREQLYSGAPALSLRLRGLAAAIQSGVATPLMLEESFAALGRELAAAGQSVEAERTRVPAKRPGTRAEIHARLQRARERMHDELATRLTLASLARSACLSPHHFHQAFRTVYGVSAHRYLTGLRLERARRLLRATDWSVTEICAAVGFESLGSFSALFKRAYGAAPSEFRTFEKRSGESPG